MYDLRRRHLLPLQSLNLLLCLEVVLGLPFRGILLHSLEPILESADDGIELHVMNSAPKRLIEGMDFW